MKEPRILVKNYGYKVSEIDSKPETFCLETFDT